MSNSANLGLQKSRSKSKLGQDFDALVALVDALLAGKVNVSFSATPAFNAALASFFRITLTGNVTSSTITNPQFVGQEITLSIVQDGTGSRTFAFPSNVKGATAINATASKESVQKFKWDGAFWIAVNAGTSF